MTRKRLIASLLVAVLSAVQVAAWAVVFETVDPSASRLTAWWSMETLLAVVSEPTLVALAGCLSILIGVGVGMVGRKPVDPRSQLPTVG